MDIIINVMFGGLGGVMDSVMSFIFWEYCDWFNVGYGMFFVIVYLVIIVIVMIFLIKVVDCWMWLRY